MGWEMRRGKRGHYRKGGGGGGGRPAFFGAGGRGGERGRGGGKRGGPRALRASPRPPPRPRRPQPRRPIYTARHLLLLARNLRGDSRDSATGRDWLTPLNTASEMTG